MYQVLYLTELEHKLKDAIIYIDKESVIF